MSNEKNTSITPARFTASLIGFGAIIDIFAAAIFGYASPFTGAVLLAAGVIAAIIAFVGGCVSSSPFARRCSYIAVGLAVLVMLAGTAALFVDKGFEDRCVEDWRELSQKSDRIERRLERLENRFDND